MKPPNRTTTSSQFVRIHDNIYSFANNRFKHGLIVKSYDTHSVSEAISTMPLQYFSRFWESCHPRLTTFPRPSEWCLAEGDAVYIVDDSDPPSYKLALSLQSGTIRQSLILTRGLSTLVG
jgi:hypothetical protein